VALWRLPRPDFHRLVDTDFQDTPLTLWPARSPSRLATLYIESSDSFVASAAVSIVTGWNEPVPGRELHPLKSSAFHGALYRQLLRKPDARDALYLALCVEGDCETVTHRSQIVSDMRHGWPVICRLTAWATSSRDAKRWRWSPPREMSRRPKGSWTGDSGAKRSEYAKPQLQSPETWSAWLTVMPRRMRRLAHPACAQPFSTKAASKTTARTIQTVFRDFLMGMSSAPVCVLGPIGWYLCLPGASRYGCH